MTPDKTEDEQIIRTVCNSHCGGICDMKVHVRDGRIVRIESGAEGDTGHRMCARGRAYRQRVYAPDRLLHPLKRVGPRGAGEFTRVSWDEALDTVAAELKRVKDAYGNAAILHFCSLADAHAVHHAQAFHRLLCLFGGYTAPWGFISYEGLAFAAGTTYGTAPGAYTYEISTRAKEYPAARLIIMWGWNPADTQQGTAIPLSLARAREAGARIVSVEPRYTDSAAAFAEQWIPIRPGADVAALTAMAYSIIKEGLHDEAFIQAHTSGFQEYRDYLFGVAGAVERSPEWAAGITAIPAEAIADLAREYATTRPSILEAGYAAGRTAYGEQFHRAVMALEAITGNARLPSGRESPFRALKHILQIPSPPNPVEADAPPRWNALPYRSATVNSSARVNVNLLADAILKGRQGGYPADYKFLWLSNTNYLNQLSDVNKAAGAFRKLDFVLVTEQFMSTTARFADIVLPVCTFLERHDFRTPRAIEPLGESRSQLDICTALAPRLGISDYSDKSDAEWVEFMTARLTEEFNRAAAPRKDPDDSAPKPLPTPSGKVEIYSSLIAGMRHELIPPLPQYIETWESRNDPLAAKYPLQLITPHCKRRAHSQFDNLPWLRDLEIQAVTINSADAKARGIRDGDMVRVFNDRGQVAIPVLVTERIMPGVVSLPQGAWYSPDEKGLDHGGCANVLTRNVSSPAGAFPSHTALVQIERYKG
ncbi:MAG: molybdopterin-dependent oxidoreductase [Dehalococcoidia bacterium]|nr:molybdopterin-dependent oxidoreductase [Dehalococcoidia bacterium]